MDTAMKEFVPPFPTRPTRPMSALSSIRAAHRNILSMWPEECFGFDMFKAPMLTRSVYVCNSPDTVAKALIDKHDAFERKSPQMRHALEPLLGDGLFISDGATWKKRRRIVAPIVHASRLPIFAPIMVEAASELAERWRAHPGPIDALEDMAKLTAEIICRTVFGRRSEKGVVVEQGVAKSVLDQPQHARTQDFLRRVLHPL